MSMSNSEARKREAERLSSPESCQAEVRSAEPDDLPRSSSAPVSTRSEGVEALTDRDAVVAGIADLILVTNGSIGIDAAEAIMLAGYTRSKPAALSAPVPDVAAERVAAADVLRDVARLLRSDAVMWRVGGTLTDPPPENSDHYTIRAEAYDRAARICEDRAAALIPEQSEWTCPTPGCEGDGRYAAPGRGHREGCRYPRDTEQAEGSDDA